MPARRSDGTGEQTKTWNEDENGACETRTAKLINVMKKQSIKVIKRDEAGMEPPPTNRKAAPRPKKPRSMESTIKDWITERRENDEAEHRAATSELAAWETDPTPAETT
jgi:hypothetical protein